MSAARGLHVMGLIAPRQFASFTQSRLIGSCLPFLLIALAATLLMSSRVAAQTSFSSLAVPVASSPASASLHKFQTREFLRGRTLIHSDGTQAMNAARRQQAAMLAQQDLSPHLSGLEAPWQAVGPAQVASLAYGKITGRVTAIAIDPADSSGNTVYLGTTGGGLWKSTNAAGPAVEVRFAPLTDTLPVFNLNAGASAIPSLSIGAVSVQPGGGVVLAGTGDPNDATDSFYGSGILRSDDRGLTWSLIQQSTDFGGNEHHSFTGLGFSGFAWSSTSPDTVVAALSQAAEGDLVNASNDRSVMGLYYSTDAGVTWQMSTIMDGSQVVQRPLPSDYGGNAATSVVWNPIRQRFYAAIRYHGYYESADGAIWTRLASQPGFGLTPDACPPNPDSTGNPSCPIFRGALAVQLVTGDTFALTVDRNNLDQGLWQDLCGRSGSGCGNPVAFGHPLSSAPLETVSGSAVIPQADYNLSLAAAPSGTDTLLYAGTIDLYRCSLVDGCHLRNTTNAVNGCAAPAMVAPAQHAIATLANSALLYLGNDGGLWRSTDGVNQQSTPCSADDATHFENLNGGLGSLAEITSFAQHPVNPSILLASLGANGTAAIASSSALWSQLSAAEGGSVAIDQTNPQLWYISTGAGVSIHPCSKGAGCSAADFIGAPTIGAAQTLNDSSLIDAPWLLDPAFPSNAIIGTCRIWRGPAGRGEQWSSANVISDLLGGPQNTSCGATNPVLRSLAAGGPVGDATAVQNAGSQVLYAGMAGSFDGGLGPSFGGHLFSITTGGTANNATVWNDRANSPVSNDVSYAHKFNPGGFDISSLAVDPHDPTGMTIYATVMGFKVPHLYRSTDGGALWTNISRNLPDAPANSVIVDPNDANTVYIALDTGVYVTTQVANCSSVNCWSIYGTSLPNAPVVQLAAAPDMPTGDGRTGELRAATYGRGIWQIPLLTAGSGAGTAASLSPVSLAFGSQTVASLSPAQTVTVTNSGGAPLSISQIAITGDFDETSTCADADIAVNESCTIQIRFRPTATGSRSGVLTIYGNVPGGQVAAALSGTGVPPAPIILTPVALTFSSTTVNATSAAKNITISNTTAAAIALQTPSVTGDFYLIANTCGSTLPANTGCTVAITFTPTASGSRTGIFTITDGAGTQIASLSGIGTLPATDTLSPLALTFASQQLTTVSAPQQVTLTNAGDEPLTLISAKIMSGDFTVVNGCANSLNPHSSCAIRVMFQPQGLGTGAGLLTVSDQYRSQTVVLSGTGVAPPGVSLSPLYTLAFPATGVGQTALPQTVALTNNGGAPLEIQSTIITGDFSIVPGSSTCGPVLAPATACTMQVVFTPTAGGARSGTLTFADSAPNSPQVLRLTGTGVDFVLGADGNTTVTITSGQNAVFPLLFTSSTAVTGAVAFTCAGVPLNAACRITPSSITLGSAPVTVSVVVLTGVPNSSLVSPAYLGSRRSFWLAALLPLGLFALRRRRLPRLASLVFLCCCLLPTGCGAGRQLPPGSSGNPPSQVSVTPSGTYPIVVSATSAGFTSTIKLTLIVK
jgi:hypothetical protein